VRDLFEDSLAGDLSRDEKTWVEAHIEDCAACSSEFRTYRSIDQSLADLPRFSCPEHVTRAICEATIHNEMAGSKHDRKWNWSFIFGWRPALAGLAAATLMLFFLWNPIEDTEKSTPDMFSGSEVAKAGILAKWSLIYAAQTMKESERRVVDDVLIPEIPGKIREVISPFF